MNANYNITIRKAKQIAYYLKSSKSPLDIWEFFEMASQNALLRESQGLHKSMVIPGLYVTSHSGEVTFSET